MIQLINNIEGKIHMVTYGNTFAYKSITGEIQQEDFINLNGFVGYLQNFSKTEIVEYLKNPMNFGLKNSYNIPIITLETTY